MELVEVAAMSRATGPGRRCPASRSGDDRLISAVTTPNEQAPQELHLDDLAADGVRCADHLSETDS